MALSLVAKVVTLVTVGLSFALAGLLSYVLFPRILEWQIEKNLVLSPDGETYEMWRDVPIPIYLRVYFFNITNPMEVWAQTNKPVLQELGPYTFRESRQKVNISWNDNGTVSYKQIRTWHFEPGMTNGSLDDIVVNVNVPMVTAASWVRYMNLPFYKYAIQEILRQSNSTLYVWKTVEELLFEGYDDILLSIAQEMGFYVPRDKFGWFYKKNDTDDNEYIIYTGARGIQNLGVINSWNGSQTIPAWEPPCDEIKGTPGEMWPPFKLHSGVTLDIFVSDVCRTLPLSYLQPVEVDGIPAHRFWADNKMLDNGAYNPENKCYCGGECLKPGVLNISACQFGAPAGISYPHFLYADSSYRQAVIGLNPDPQLHQFFIDVVPEMGIPINVHAKIQINVMVQPDEDIEQFSNLTGMTVYPALWFSETATLDGDLIDKVRLVVNFMPYIMTIVAFVLVIIGGIILTAALLLVIRYSRGKVYGGMTYSAVRVPK